MKTFLGLLVMGLAVVACSSYVVYPLHIALAMGLCDNRLSYMRVEHFDSVYDRIHATCKDGRYVRFDVERKTVLESASPK